jgi:hypothetical protein
MPDFTPQPNYSGPTTTASSMAEGRLKVGVDTKKKKKAIIKKYLKNK